MVYLGDGTHQCGWGEVLPSPGSEPPPPYSPPRTHNRQFFPAAFSNPNYYHTHNYYDLTPDSSPPDSLTSQETTPIKDAPPPYPPMSSLKAAHAAALNHSDSSAFSPPKSKCNFNSPPPPAYTPTYNPHPNNNISHPNNSASNPNNSASHPNNSASHPNNSALHPNSSVPFPNNSAAHPNNSVLHPNSSVPFPNNSAAHPNSSAPHPNNSVPHPNSSAPHPSSIAPHPNNSASHPNISASHPNNSAPQPNVSTLHPNKSHLHSNNNAPLLKMCNVQQPKPATRKISSQSQPGTSKPTNQVPNHSSNHVKGAPIPKVVSNTKGSVSSKSSVARLAQGRDVVATEPRGRGAYRPQEPSKQQLNIAKIQEKSRSLDRDSRPRLLSHPPVIQQDQPRVPYIGTMGPVRNHMSSGPHSLMGEGYVDHRNPHRGRRDIHPGQGPLLRTGKSLELPRSRAPTNHHHQHPMPTAHTHPRHHNPIPTSNTHTKENIRNFSTSKSSSSSSSLKNQQHQVTKEPQQGSTALSKSSKLAYVGIAPAKPVRLHERTSHHREHAEKHHPRNNQVGGRVASRSEERWLSKASHLEQQAAKACTAVRAVPVNTGTPQRRTANPYRIDLEVHSPPGRPYNPILDDPFGTRGRLRTCRSLDELSDLLDDESPNSRLLPSASRSLDDLTDPIYENVDVIHSHTRLSPHHAHNSSVDNLLDPPRPPRHRNNSLSSLLDDLANAGRANSLARQGHNISVPDVLESDKYTLGSLSSTLRSCSSVTTSRDDTQDISVQLKKIQEVAKILGVKYRNGELSSGSGSESCSTDTSPRGHPKLEELQHHSLDYLSSNHYPQQQQTPAPAPPARAPVIHDISGILKEKQDLQKPYSAHSTHGTDADATSQESGYGSVDSRTFRQRPSPEQHVKQHLSMHMQSHHQSLEYQINNTNVRTTHPRQLQVHKPSQHQYQQQQKYQRQEQYREPKPSMQVSQHQQQNRHQKQSQPYQSLTTKNNNDNNNNSNKSSQQPTLSPPRQIPAVELQMNWISPHQQQTLQKLLQGYYPIQWLKQGVNQDKLGIYIKSVVPGGAADADGRLQAGDQLLSVDGKSLLGITQEQAAAYMMETGPVVTLEVARQGAIFHGLATLLSQPSPQVNRGYPGGGRHMSERDLPSKVLRDPHHPDQTPSHPHHPHQQGPRMQAAKSVPSLNSEGERVGKAGHEVVFNPAYSRTSSNQSLAQNSGQHPHHPGQQHPHQHQHNHLQQRSRSTQNLSESRSVGEEERHYQNVSFHQGGQDPRMASMRGRPQNAPPPLGSPASQGSDGPIHRPPEHLRPASAFLQREDVGRPGDLQRPASQRDLRADAKMAEMQEEVRRREDRFRHNNGPISPVQVQQQRGGTLPQQQQRGPGGFPTSPYGPPQEGFSPQQHQFPPGYQGQQGQQVTSPHGQAQHQPMFGHGPQQTSATHPGYSGKHGPPPTAPKPRPGSTNAAPNEAPEKPLRHYGQDGIPSDGGPPRPPPPEDGYRESPPPPPPPTSTHPLFQTNNRPASSSGFANTANAHGKGNFSKSSPWEREEKEKYEVRRREGVRQWRDELITGLENLEIRTPEQNERLGTLRLERDFQQRAEATLRNKGGGDNDDDDDDDDDDDEDEENEDNHEYRDQSTLEYNRTNLEQPKVNGGGPVDERSRKEDEIRRKQQELEAASEAEERLLREAQRRQEEEMRRYQHQQQMQHQQHLQQQQQLHHQQQQQQLHHQQQQSGYQHQHQASQRLDSLVLSSPGSGGQQSSYSNGPVNGSVRSPQGSYSSSETVMKVDPGQPSPQPPERGSSYNIMQQSGSNRNYKSPESSAPVKRVQFSEATNADPLSHITFDTNANHEKAPREDPDHFLNEAENMLNSSPTRTTGGTPGVIGAQEIYRDPRWRRMQEQQAQQAAAKAPVPEKLTFKEKMKMFAMETGENDSPKDRVKNSRAERDIQAPQQ